jgi:hypothetical protein
MSVYRTTDSVRALPRLAATFAATLAASCASAPDGGGEGSLERLWEASTSHAPQAALRSHTPAADDLEADDADARWGVDRVLVRIAEANPTLGAAEARLEAARAAHDAALAQWWPQLSLGLEYAATDNPSMAFAQLLNQQAVTLGPGFDATPGWIENWRKELRVDWPLFAPGRAQDAAAPDPADRRCGRDGRLGDRVRPDLLRPGLGLRFRHPLEHGLHVARDPGGVRADAGQPGCRLGPARPEQSLSTRPGRPVHQQLALRPALRRRAC